MNKSVRSLRTLTNGRKSHLLVEMLEDRCLPSAGAFLQGFAFVDANHNGKYDTGEGMANTTIQLFAADSTTLVNYPGSTLSTVLASATTPASGYYFFNDASIQVANSSGLAPGNYLLIETPPSSYNNAGTDIQSQVDSATQVSPSTIAVTVPNPTTLMNHYDGNGAGADDSPTFNGNPMPGFTGQLNVRLTATNPAFTSPEFTTLCLGIDQSVVPGTAFPVLPSTSIANGPEIAYLYNHYGTMVLDAIHAEALQEAVWTLEYGNAFVPDLSHTGVTAAYNFYLSDAAGKNEVALFLDLVPNPKGPSIGQTMIATGSLNFNNLLAVANPALVTTASQAVTLGTSATTISDTAVLFGGNAPTGTINFTLMLGSMTVFTTSDPVSGNGSYTASYPLPTTGTVTGTYTWSATYSGDANNHGASDQGGAAEQTVVSPANPTINSMPGGTVILGSGNKLTDSATLSGGYNPTGTITFTLYDPNNMIVYTDIVPVTGDGTYTIATGSNPGGFLPTIAGTYQWVVSYGGDGNNISVAAPLGAEPETVTSQTIGKGDFATIGFWHNKNGQALIKSLNGGPTSTALAQWLATTFPNLYGPNAGANSMAPGGHYLTNAQVAALYLTGAFFGASGMKVNSQILTTALAAYATSTTLAGGSQAQGYGFNVSPGGSGFDTFNIGSHGAAYGVPNNTTLTVFQMLQAVNSQAVNGVLYANAGANQSLYIGFANNDFTTINETGDIM
jgi:hypothetical protein